jgi:uncharacterized protein (DUF486 family)
MPSVPAWLLTVVLLVGSNIFMTFAWYYHLQKKEAWPLLIAIGVSWLIALPEYILQVPANRIGSSVFTLPQLKIMQEAITLAVFTVFTIIVAKQTPTWRDFVAMLLIFAAVAVTFSGSRSSRSTAPESAGSAS